MTSGRLKGDLRADSASARARFDRPTEVVTSLLEGEPAAAPMDTAMLAGMLSIVNLDFGAQIYIRRNRKSEFWINRLNYSLFFMPRNVFPRMHAKCNALAQTSFESTRKHTKFMKNLFFPLGRHRSGRRRTCASTFDMDVNVNMNVNVNTNIYI